MFRALHGPSPHGNTRAHVDGAVLPLGQSGSTAQAVLPLDTKTEKTAHGFEHN